MYIAPVKQLQLQQVAVSFSYLLSQNKNGLTSIHIGSAAPPIAESSPIIRRVETQQATVL